MEKLHNVLEQLVDEMPGGLDDDVLFTDLDAWDSLKYVRLVMAIETEFGIELSAEEIQLLTSIAGVRGVLARRGIELA